MNKYFHYTCRYHLETILRTGCLRLTQGILDDMAVWLTTMSNPRQSWQGNERRVGTTIDKSEIRFTVTGGNIIPWTDYKMRQENRDTEEKRMWIKLLETKNNYKSWFISEEIIPLENVESIENSRTGKKVYLGFNVLRKNKELSEVEILRIVNELG